MASTARSTLLDTDAASKVADADMALQELGSDEIGQAYVTATVTVWDEDPGVAAEKLRLVEKVIPAASGLDTKPCPYDAPLGCLGRAGAR